MALSDLKIHPIYIGSQKDFVEEVLISSFKQSSSVDCMFGFFHSTALKLIAPGLVEYFVNSSNPMRLVVSPNIDESDADALREGLKTPRIVLEERLVSLIGDAKLSDNALVNHTLTCLAYMLATERLKFRVALLRDGSLFHPKVWFFRDNDQTVVAHGSSNMTFSGLFKNHEQVCVDASWEGGHAPEIIATLTNEFNSLWNGSSNQVISIDLPVALKNNLIREYKTEIPPTIDDFRKAWHKDQELEKNSNVVSSCVPSSPVQTLVIPEHLDLHNGSFAHQGKALEAWERANRRGILSMATGSGKTITALAGATRLQNEIEALLVVVSAPYTPLISQWIEEVSAFGVVPIPMSGKISERASRLDLAIRGLQTRASSIEVAVVTEKFLTSTEFREVFDELPDSVKSLLIADEVHNLGKQSFISNTPDRFDYRLGLSATPERQYDLEGTAALFNFFGNPVFEFSLREAIGVCLVPYNYYIHQVELSSEEYEEWANLTEQLARKGFSGDADVSDAGTLSQAVKQLLIARRRVIESAKFKVDVLRHLLQNRSRDDIKHVLIYATDKNPRQLQNVNDMLQQELNLTIHEITSSQSSNRTRLANLLESFANGDYNALTCKRILDEGVDVPQVSEAFLLASNSVRRQWIQRRGRILRKCDDLNKNIAHLHDFIVVPPNIQEACSKSILKGELKRAREFALLSSNAGSSGGPFDKIENLVNTMY